MEFRSKKRVNVRFVSDNDVTNIFVPLDERLCASQNVCEVNKINENIDCNLPEVSVARVQNRPSCLFENGDVAGQQIFGFQTPKQRNAVVNKVSDSACKSPRTPLQEKVIKKSTFVYTSPASCKDRVRNKTQQSPLKHKSSGLKTHATSTPPRSPLSSQKISFHRKGYGTPKTSKELQYSTDVRGQDTVLPQTPYNLRKRFKEKLVAVTTEEHCYSDEDEELDFSASESEFDCSSGSDASNSAESSGEDSERSGRKMILTQNGKKLGPSESKNLKLSFVPAAEEYFQSHSSRKVHTSNHTLGKLRHHLPQERLQELLSETTSTHEKLLAKLQCSVRSLFGKWNFLLREGFNILLYGVGSKHKLLSSFHQQLPEPSVVVNGFFPSLTIQEIVASVAEDILDLHGTSADLLEVVDSIRNVFSQRHDIQLYLVVHNVDGIMLRNDRSQEVLAHLSSTPNIHLIASIDHISAPLMWDQNMLSMFNFSWWDATTFEPYVNETAFESSLLVQQSGNLALSSLQNVFRSLTNNAKSIFLLMAEYQKEHKDSTHYNGMPFKKLYTLCRESLLVSSDLALRSQLTEFLDHRLVKSRRGPDGSELLIIPIDTCILDQFVTQQAVL